MAKKMIVSVVLILVAGLLVAGAVNRTIAKSGQETALGEGRAGGSGQGRGQAALETAPDSLNQPLDAGDRRGNQGGRGQGGGRQVEGGRPQQAVPNSVAAGSEGGQELEGVVVSSSADLLVVDTTAGEVEIQGRPWSFAQEQGFRAGPGDAITLQGFYEGETFEVSAVSNHSSGQSLQIREASGRPLWAGRGGRS